jgi:DNA-binding NarL/FixJ family response regulator
MQLNRRTSGNEDGVRADYRAWSRSLVMHQPCTEHRGLQPPTKVLIVEPREMAAEAMARAVSATRGLSLSACCSSTSAIAACCRVSPPDMAVLHLAMYGDDPRTAVASIREHSSNARVLLLASAVNEEGLARALVAGAGNLVRDSLGRREFVLALRATAVGRSLVPPDLQRIVWTHIARLRTEGGALSRRELEVLRLASRGMGDAAIAKRMFISVATTRTHLQRAYRKLGAVNRGGAITIALRRGLLRL